MAYKPMEIEFQFRNKRFKDADKGLQYFSEAIKSDYQKVGPVLRKDLETWLKGVSSAMGKLHSSPWSGGVKSDARFLQTRSGNALKSIDRSVRVTGDKPANIEGQIGGLFYIKTQEKGATITPKKAKYLAVPLPAALDARGVPIKAKPRDWDNTFVKRHKRHGLIIYRKVGKKKIVALYMLVKKVVIPPRLVMGQTMKVGKKAFVDMAQRSMLVAIRGK